MPLSTRQRETLRAICDTFVPSLELPGAQRTPSASELGVPRAVEEAVDSAPRKADRQQTALLLSALNSRALTALGGGGLKHFAELPLEAREQVLLSWADSRLPQRRAVFQALRKAAVAMTYARESAMWELIGYPGPPTNGDRPGTPLKPLQPLQISGDTRLDCDVVVVGSGAGGGTAAAVLAQHGLDVIVLEAGAYHAEPDFDGHEAEALKRMYLNGGGVSSDDQSIGLLAGQTLGGGTVINYSTSFRTPDGVREEWAAHGVPAFASETYTQALDAVCDRLGVNRENSEPSRRDQLMLEALQQRGWHADSIPRNVRDCRGRCGFCGYGCPYGNKQSVLNTWLQDHAAAGGRIVTETFADRICTSGGAATGVLATHHPTGAPLTVRSRAVVVAAGALHTPALLRRSGFSNENIGRHLRLHPATAVWGVMDEEVRGWEGTMQAVYSDQFADLDGEGYGLKFETAALQPLILFSFAPWRSGRQHFETMQTMPNLTAVGILLRDKDAGEVRTGRDGHPIVRYRLSERDARHLRTGIEGGVQLLQTAGARRIFTSHAKLVETRSGDTTALMRDADAAGYGSGQVTLGSFHIMGTARMGGHPTTAACDPTGQTYDVRDVVVCDGSAFPTASGVNPMISIEAIAYMNARALAERLSRTSSPSRT
jgi:choline dehydrogenase-like flavoprotein